MKKVLFTDRWTYGLKGEEKVAVALPHDAMQLQERHPDEKSGSGCAYFPGGIYTYEKTWTVPKEDMGKKVMLLFEGVYRNTIVKVNGQVVREKHYGYISFIADLTDALKEGENVIEVEADNSQTPNSRWYSGGGIYRPVWLLTGDDKSIKPYGVKVKTLSIQPAKVRVTVDAGASDAEVEILYDGQAVAKGNGCDVEFEIDDAKLWDEEHPELYTCKVTAMEDGVAVDTYETSFGIRMVECSPKGLFVNGKETLLRGGCIHSDNGIIGVASCKEAEYRKVKLLKGAGFNALRIAHNPASPALLDVCDQLGMYVMDEGWDMWYKRKTKFDYGMHFMDDYAEDIQTMVDIDYNHPSVLMYSIGNEISEPAEEKGIAMAKTLADGFRALDDTRLVTVGCNITILANSKAGNDTFDPESDSSNGNHDNEPKGMDSTAFNEMISNLGNMMENAANSPEADEASTPVFDQVDIAGYNYAFGRYTMDGELHPERVIVGSETFPHCIYRNWQLVKELPYLIGDFMWTAIDYIGEVGIGAWSYTEDGCGFTKPYPWVLAESGALDLIGTPTGEQYMAQAAWDVLDAPAIAVAPDLCYPGVIPAKGGWRGSNAIPSWSFSGCEGRAASVEVYSADAELELLINGKSQGRKKTADGRAVFDCVYESGTLTAVSYDASGNEAGRSTLESATGSLSLRLTQEEGCEAVKAGSVVYVDVDIVGENGVVESNADAEVTVTVEGGTLLGFGSARARTAERFTDGKYTTYYGRALAAVKVGESGKAVIKAVAKDMAAECELR